MPVSSVLQTTEHSDSVGRRGGVEWHRQMLRKSRPIHDPPWVSGLEKDEASTSQAPWQRTAHQVGVGLKEQWPQHTYSHLAPRSRSLELRLSPTRWLVWGVSQPSSEGQSSGLPGKPISWCLISFSATWAFPLMQHFLVLPLIYSCPE